MARESSIKLSIVYDSETLSGFEGGWGFSALLSSGGVNLLFDCGWDGHILRRNLGRMGYSLADIGTVVLSHAHWDHVGGLTEVLQHPDIGEGLSVVLHDGFSQRMRKEIGARATVIEADGPREIIPDVWTLGPLGKEVKEQALLVVTPTKALVITGCAHPGVRSILERASEVKRPTSIMGGFHGAKAEEFPDSLEGIVTCHCTEHREDILRAFPGKVTIGKAGASIEF